MMNARLMKLSPKSMRYVGMTVFYQWIGLLFNMLAIFSIAFLIEGLFNNTLTPKSMGIGFALIGLSIIVRFFMNIKSTHASYKASSGVKDYLRDLIYHKLLDLGLNYNEVISTSRVVQLSSEGVEQIEIYFGRYMPQFFYSLLAPLTLFAVLSFINIKVSLILLICVPLIPMSIIAVNKFAKKLFSKYWDLYTGLGDHFLDDLQGLTTLKVYQDDAHCNEKMNVDAEHFRKITMKVLTMQLNSVTLMDLIAYGGAALGIIFALIAYANNNIDLGEMIVFLLLTSEFFIPLRLLGSFFHVAMNGVSAANSIFELLDTPIEKDAATGETFENGELKLSHINFSYEPTRPILRDINLTIPEKGFVSFVGESGCGKSTIVSLIMGFHSHYDGSISIGKQEISSISRNTFMKNVCVIKHQNYLFKGTVRENLLMAMPNATDEMLMLALEKVNLHEFIQSNGGLDLTLQENGSNLSGGQAQRLALARALLHDAKIYIFDEATSNIDVESENIIHTVIKQLAKEKTIILISHRLANVIDSDQIFVLDSGTLVEQGTHTELLEKQGHYAHLYTSQKELEDCFKGGNGHA